MLDNKAQKDALAFRLPALDHDFLLGDSMRGLRFFLEYAKAEELLRAWGVRSTVVVFGSARVMTREENAVPASPLPGPGGRAAWWYDQARRLGRIVSERGGAMTPVDGMRDNVIATGGGPGIMEAANRGAADVGAPSIGFNIRLPSEQEPNAYSTPDLTFQFHYFAMRKMHLAMRAAALVVFPGGFGTFDELFEVLNLVQTGKMRPLPIVCFDRRYWTEAVDFDLLADEGMIARADLELFTFADDAEETWRTLIARGLKIPPETPSKAEEPPVGRDL
jgi:uncharacterized protein (TIGR00730 family)